MPAHTHILLVARGSPSADHAIPPAKPRRPHPPHGPTSVGNDLNHFDRVKRHTKIGKETQTLLSSAQPHTDLTAINRNRRHTTNRTAGNNEEPR